MRDFLKHGSLVFIGTLGANALFYAAYALVQRSLGVEDAGLFMALLAATQLLSMPGTVLATVIAKISADASAAGRQGVLRALSHQMSLLLVPLILLAAIVSVLLNGWLRSYFHTTDPLTIAFTALAFALFFPLAPQRAVFQGGGFFGAFVLSGLIEAALKAGTGLALLTVGGSSRLAFAGFGAATALAYGYNALVGMRIAKNSEAVSLPSDTAWRHIIGVVLPVSGLTAVTFADAILARHYLPAYDSGLYAIVALVGRAIVTITQFVPTVLMPKATEAVAQGRSAAPLLGLAAASTAVVVLPILVIVAFFSGDIAAGVAGGAFRPAAPLMLPYAVAMAGLAGATVMATYLIGIDHRKFAIPMTVVCLFEIAAIVAVHPDVTTIVHIVLAGHLSIFATMLTATGFSLRSRPASAKGLVVAAIDLAATQSAE